MPQSQKILPIELTEPKLGLPFSFFNVLVVTDGATADLSNLAFGGNFGFSSVIQELENSVASESGSTIRFRLSRALRDGDAFVDRGRNTPINEIRYTGLRFDAVDEAGNLFRDRFQAILMFGWWPGSRPGPDSEIEGTFPESTRPLLPSSDELAALDGWMNRGGGIFATGDHGRLGASMCRDIPRVGSMRKWTNADGAPPPGRDVEEDPEVNPNPERRLNTNQPSGRGEIFVSDQRDEIPQPIELVKLRLEWTGSAWKRLPHEILQWRGTYIDVMPDHNHEGLCNERDEINLNKKVTFSQALEYPDTIPGLKALLPAVIAYGRTTSEFEHEDDPVLPRRFPMISVYPQVPWRTEIGRVVVDSTWHHWMNMNIDEIIEQSGGNWEKIRGYFINVLLFLIPPGLLLDDFYKQLALAPFVDIGPETFDFPNPASEITPNARSLKRHLKQVYGDGITQYLTLLLLRFFSTSVVNHIEDNFFNVNGDFNKRPDSPFAGNWQELETTLLDVAFVECQRVASNAAAGGETPGADELCMAVETAMRALSERFERELAKAAGKSGDSSLNSN